MFGEEVFIGKEGWELTIQELARKNDDTLWQLEAVMAVAVWHNLGTELSVGVKQPNRPKSYL